MVLREAQAITEVQAELPATGTPVVLQDTKAQVVVPPGTEVPAAGVRVTEVREVVLPARGVRDTEAREAVHAALDIAGVQVVVHGAPEACAVQVDLPAPPEEADHQEGAEVAVEGINHPKVLIS